MKLSRPPFQSRDVEVRQILDRDVIALGQRMIGRDREHARITRNRWSDDQGSSVSVPQAELVRIIGEAIGREVRREDPPPNHAADFR